MSAPPKTYELQPGERPTLKAISRLTGFAVPTVSRALSGATEIAARTRQVVNECARAIGYEPSRTGLQLRTGRTYNITLVLEAQSDAITNTSILISGMSQALSGTSYQLSVVPSASDFADATQVRRIVENRLADGLIMSFIRRQDERVDYLIERGFPFVTHGRTEDSSRHSYYDLDDAVFCRLALEALARRGRRHALLIAPAEDFNFGHVIRSTLLNEAAAYGLTVTVAPMCHAQHGIDEIQAGVLASMAVLPDVDCIISTSQSSMIAACLAVEARGHVIGMDFDIFGKENLPFLKKLKPGVLMASQSLAATGAFLCNAVLQQIETPPEKRKLVQFLEVPTFDDPRFGPLLGVPPA
ncbi:MAG: transcriptional regulator [Paracoccus sp. (in: a-proteobacteria)]|uniref:transcriptional regulator n=1 Tax=Paracoccus sp. TaxID=267 RepID=UPI00391D7332